MGGLHPNRGVVRDLHSVWLPRSAAVTMASISCPEKVAEAKEKELPDVENDSPVLVF